MIEAVSEAFNVKGRHIEFARIKGACGCSASIVEFMTRLPAFCCKNITLHQDAGQHVYIYFIILQGLPILGEKAP